MDSADLGLVTADCIVLRLDRHLAALSESFALPEPASKQLQLFPVGMAAAGLRGMNAVRR